MGLKAGVGLGVAGEDPGAISCTTFESFPADELMSAADKGHFRKATVVAVPGFANGFELDLFYVRHSCAESQHACHFPFIVNLDDEFDADSDEQDNAHS